MSIGHNTLYKVGNGANSGQTIKLESGDSLIIETPSGTNLFTVDGSGNGSFAGTLDVTGDFTTTAATITDLVAGTANFTGAMTIDSTMLLTNVSTIAAAGTNLATATAITSLISIVTGADDAKGVALPTAAAGVMRFVYNSSTTEALKVWANTSDTIGGADHYLLKEGQMAICIAVSSADWAVTGVLGTAD